MSTQGPAPAVRLPVMFYDDHESRELPTPPTIKRTKRYVWIDPTHEHVAELVSDAKYYADPQGFDPDVARRLAPAARALLAAIARAHGEGW